MEHNSESKAVEQNRDVMYQVSLLQSLINGDYSGSVTVAELKRHGDIGIGTFDGLNGELIMLGGETYRAAGDGSVEAVSDNVTVPFAVVTFMDTALKRSFLKATMSLDGIDPEELKILKKWDEEADA